MGFYVRQSIRLGPIRLNISDSGVGISPGINTGQVPTGPRGTYVSVSRDGIRYRRRADGTVERTPRSASGTAPNQTDSFGAPDLVESTCTEMIEDLNARIRQRTHSWAVGILTAILAAAAVPATGYLLSSSLSTSEARGLSPFVGLLLASLVLILGGFVTWSTHQQGKLARTTTLRYELDKEAQRDFAAIQRACAALANSDRVWRIVSDGPVWDWGKSAGPSSSVQRRAIKAGPTKPPFIATQWKVYGTDLGTARLFFLPDQILVLRNGRYSAIGYDQISVEARPKRFMEHGPVPPDAQVVDHTWQYVRRDGGPDLRFSNNQSIPVVEYGLLSLQSPFGLDCHLFVSDLSRAFAFAQAFSAPSRRGSRQSRARSSSKRRPKGTGARKRGMPENARAYKTLNIGLGASQAEITTAYRKMAQMYHPDKVAGMGPEVREAAEKRMKAINAAYEQLRK